MKKNAYSLRALALLLSYPDADMRSKLTDIMSVLSLERALSPSRISELKNLSEQLQSLDPLEVESWYVETFDRGRSTCLNLFEHVHGDSRDRGPAMIDLSQTYAQTGLVLDPDELPDHLCVVLEFASTQTEDVAKSFLDEMAHILNSIFSALLKRESPYATVIAAVLELSGHKAQAVNIPVEESMDSSWQEPEAFDGCQSRGQSKPNLEQPLHFVKNLQQRERVSS
jgi:nitrate reductase delta subunit